MFVGIFLQIFIAEREVLRFIFTKHSTFLTIKLKILLASEINIRQYVGHVRPGIRTYLVI